MGTEVSAREAFPDMTVPLFLRLLRVYNTYEHPGNGKIYLNAMLWFLKLCGIESVTRRYVINFKIRQFLRGQSPEIIFGIRYWYWNIGLEIDIIVGVLPFSLKF